MQQPQSLRGVRGSGEVSEAHAHGEPFTNGSQPSVGGRDEKDLPKGCHFHALPVQGVEIFFGMQGSSYDQSDGQRRAICRRRPPLPAAMCCTPNTELQLGHGATGNPFSDDMVLQHAPQKAAIFGLARAGATVTVHYGGKAYSAQANPDPFAQSPCRAPTTGRAVRAAKQTNPTRTAAPNS